METIDFEDYEFFRKEIGILIIRISNMTILISGVKPKRSVQWISRMMKPEELLL